MSEPTVCEYTVMSLRDQQLWVKNDAGTILRAWKPEQAGPEEGARIRVYLGDEAEAIGWYDPDSGVAVNQRCFDGASPAEPRLLACRGDCGLVWEAPAAAAVLAAEPCCLQCNGDLRPQ